MNKPTAREPRTIDSRRLPFSLLLALILITFSIAHIPADDEKTDSVDQNKVPIQVRSRNFTEGDALGNLNVKAEQVLVWTWASPTTKAGS